MADTQDRRQLIRDIVCGISKDELQRYPSHQNIPAEIIPYEKLKFGAVANAIHHFASGLTSEDTAVLCSTSLFGVGKAGVVFTTEGFYFNDLNYLRKKNPIPMPVRYDELTQIKWGKDKSAVMILVYADGREEEAYGNIYKAFIVDAVNRILAALDARETSEAPQENTTAESATNQTEDVPFFPWLNADGTSRHQPVSEARQHSDPVAAPEPASQPVAVHEPESAAIHQTVDVPPAPVSEPVTSTTPQVSAPGDDDYQEGVRLRGLKDYDGAFTAWMRAANQGHHDAMRKIIRCYCGIAVLGGGFRDPAARARYTDYDKAIEYGTYALSKGVDVASDIMTAYEKKGMPEEALAFGTQAAAQGWNTQYDLMSLCLDMERYQEAYNWAAECDRRHPESHAREGLVRTGNEAFTEAVSAYNEERYEEALRLFKKSAALAPDAATFGNLGLMYELGQGVTADLQTAMIWYERAADQGNERAASKISKWNKAREITTLLGQSERAEELYKGGSDDIEQAAMNKGREYYFAGNYGKAAPLLIYVMDEGWWEAFYLLGRMHAGGHVGGLSVQENADMARILYGHLQARPIGKRYKISFGTYPQGAHGETVEPIRWIVLDRRDDRLLLLSDKVLDVRKYHGEFEPVTWQKSDIRKWLNGEFLLRAFSAEERRLIRRTSLDNPDNTDYDTAGGNATEDQIFLLSIKEAQKYFIEGIPERKDKGKESGNADFNGVYLYSTDTIEAVGYHTDYAEAQKVYSSEYGTSWWWLRSPGIISMSAAYVTVDGYICVSGLNVLNAEGGVRPALWLNLES